MCGARQGIKLGSVGLGTWLSRRRRPWRRPDATADAPEGTTGALALLLRKAFDRVATDAGQTAITLAITVFFLGTVGVMVIDVGAWLGDRRDAQSDADFIAMAGALELPSFTDDVGASADAYQAALDWAIANDVVPSDVTIEVVDTCFSGHDEVHTGVRATVQRETRTFLLPFVSDMLPTVGATALACTGSATSLFGFMPWALEQSGTCFQDDPLEASRRIPAYGERCDIVVGGGGGSDVGQLGFAAGGPCNEGNSSADDYENDIINGVETTCAIGDSVTSNPGVNVGKSLSGLEARFAVEGDCDTMSLAFHGDVVNRTSNFNVHIAEDIPSPPDLGGIDDFFEIWGPDLDYDTDAPAENLVQYDCSTEGGTQTSPRNIVVIMIEDIGTDDGTGCVGSGSPHCYIVRGFARLYLEGCSNSHGWSDICDLHGGGGTFTIHGRFVESVGESYGDIGLPRYGAATTTFLKE